MKDIKVLGIDLAKNVFQLHGVKAKGKCALKKRLNREKLIEFISQLPPCLVGIEACGGAHYWARMFIEMGHTVKMMMAPQFVKPVSVRLSQVSIRDDIIFFHFLFDLLCSKK
jgi:transposase